MLALILRKSRALSTELYFSIWSLWRSHFARSLWLVVCKPSFPTTYAYLCSFGCIWRNSPLSLFDYITFNWSFKRGLNLLFCLADCFVKVSLDRLLVLLNSNVVVFITWLFDFILTLLKLFSSIWTFQLKSKYLKNLKKSFLINFVKFY